MKIFYKVLVAVVFAAMALSVVGSPVETEAAASINNSALMPKYVTDDKVGLQDDNSPEWMKGLIMAQFRIETITSEGTFQSAVKALDHYAEMGVNGLWINPIWKRNPETVSGRNNGYGNWGPEYIEPSLTGLPATASYEESCKVVKTFVDEAHKRNIRVIFDTIAWGTTLGAPLPSQHPEFYALNSDGTMKEGWGGYLFNWNSRELKDWFREWSVKFIMNTGADGYRVDLAPDTSGYFFKEVKDELLAKGRKIMVMSEIASQHRGAFDIEQVSNGWGPEDKPYNNPALLAELRAKYGHAGDCFIKSKNNIVDSVRSGYLIGESNMQAVGAGSTFRYYTFNILNHDDYNPNLKGNRVKIGYQAIFAPFIPMWYAGEEWNNPREWVNDLGTGVMYFNKINWNAMEIPANKAFYEDFKKYIQIRRTYTDIFEYFPSELKGTNIEKVSSKVDGRNNSLQAYARFQKNRAVIIVPNYGDDDSTLSITPKYNKIGFSGAYGYKITDLFTGKEIKTAKAGELTSFEVKLASNYVGIYMIEAINSSGAVIKPGSADELLAPKETSDIAMSNTTSKKPASSKSTGGTNDQADNTIGGETQGDNTNLTDPEPGEVTVIKKPDNILTQGEFPLVLMICTIVFVVLVAGGSTVFILIKKRMAQKALLQEILGAEQAAPKEQTPEKGE